MILNYIIAITTVIISSYLYVVISYHPKCQENSWLAYSLGVFVALFSVNIWVWLVRGIKDPNNILVLNCVWDIGITVLVLLLPVVLYDIKFETKTLIGCIIAVIGIIIAKV